MVVFKPQHYSSRFLLFSVWLVANLCKVLASPKKARWSMAGAQLCPRSCRCLNKPETGCPSSRALSGIVRGPSDGIYARSDTGRRFSADQICVLFEQRANKQTNKQNKNKQTNTWTVVLASPLVKSESNPFSPLKLNPCHGFHNLHQSNQVKNYQSVY